MKIGIILYSHSGNTLSVAEGLKEALTAKGHECSIERIRALNEDPQNKQPIVLNEIPDVSSFDEIIFGAPVQAFSLNPIMKTYLHQLSELKGKKISCFVTQHFPKAWMGGNRAMKQMKKEIISRNGNVGATGIINWTNKRREEQIKDVIGRLSLYEQ